MPQPANPYVLRAGELPSPARAHRALNHYLTPLCSALAVLGAEVAPASPLLGRPEIPILAEADDLFPNPQRVQLSRRDALADASSALVHPDITVATIPFRPGQLRVALAQFYAMEAMYRLVAHGETTTTAYGREHRSVESEARDWLRIATFWHHVPNIMAIAAVTTAQAIAQAAYHHDLARNRSPQQWMATIADSGVLERLAMTLPLNVMGPMNSTGLVFAHPLMPDDAPSALTADFDAFLRHEKFVWGRNASKISEFDRAHGQASAGTGCPVASPPLVGGRTGIASLAHLYLQYFTYYYDRSDRLQYRPGRVASPRALGHG